MICVGLIVGVVVGALAAAVMCWRVLSLRYRNNVLKKPLERVGVERQRTVRSNRPPLPSCRVNPRRMFQNSQPREISPPPPMTPHSAMSSEQDARSLSGMVSLEESLFTPNPSYARVLRFSTTRVGSTKSYRVPRVLRKDSMEIRTTRSIRAFDRKLSVLTWSESLCVVKYLLNIGVSQLPYVIDYR
jgi:hypothetical protein